MFNRTKVVNLEVSQPIQKIDHLEDYQLLQGVVRFQGLVLGYVWLPVPYADSCPAQDLAQAVLAHQVPPIARELIYRQLTTQVSSNWDASTLLKNAKTAPMLAPVTAHWPTVSVVVCPRIEELALLPTCLETIQGSSLPPLEVIVPIPSNSTAFASIQATYLDIRWLLTPDDNRSAQRNIAIEFAQGDIVAFVEASCRVDTEWIAALAKAFIHNPDASFLVGCVVPDDVETEAEAWFEQGYGLWRGGDRTWHQLDRSRPVPWPTLEAMPIGSAVNMAFRRSLLTQLGPFDPLLGQMGWIWDGAYLDMVSRVLLGGHTILYEPTVLLRYHGPTSPQALQAQVEKEVIALHAYLIAGWLKYPALRSQFFKLGLWKVFSSGLSLVRSRPVPWRFALSEFRAIWRGWTSYLAAKRLTTQSKSTFPQSAEQLPLATTLTKATRLMAVRTVELHQPIEDLTDVVDYQMVRIFVTADGMPIGSVDIGNACRPITAARLCQAIATGLTTEILALAHEGEAEAAWSALTAALNDYLLPPSSSDLETTEPVSLPNDIPVSIVITTCDRPDDLEDCLRHLIAQQTQRPVEIIVADNRPASGITPKVLAKFPTIKLVQESRPGASYGRNAGITTSTGDIIVTIDDDVAVPPDWLEKLIAPMARPEVAVVTGNVLPRELETPAQFLFEKLKGGLSSGFRPFEVDRNWLTTSNHLPPIWDLGVSANAAFRATIFCEPRIGLMDEVLGPGTPLSSGEECYLIYRILRAGHTLVYEPSAFVWHRHRREMADLYHQVYSHMKGGMGFMMRAWLQDKDQRAFRHLFFEMPRYLGRRVYERLRGWHDAPWPFVWNEIKGYGAHFWCYGQSCQRVKHQGRSDPYIPVAQRSPQGIHAPADAEQITERSSLAPHPATSGNQE